MKIYKWLLMGWSLCAVSACTEDIIIDAPEGKKVPVVEGELTDEFKRHEIVLSYSSGLYSHDKEMISNAVVYVVGGGDTIYYHEQEDLPGHYFTEPVAGRKRTRYHLEINVEENTWYSGSLRIYSDVRMPNNADCLDSLRLLPKLDGNDIPLVDDNAAVYVCPYFQTLDDASIVYKVQLYLNGKRFKNRPSQLIQLFPMQGYAGYYFNGPEMLQNNVEVPLGIMNTEYLHDGDTVKMKLCSISKEYMYYLMNQELSIGVNPVMGAFPAMYTNLFSNCDAIGWFEATSVIENEGYFHEDMFHPNP